MPTVSHTCQECGTHYTPRSRRPMKFCTRKCAQTFTNRRLLRGALMYDLFMASRYERAEHQQLRSVMARMAMRFREEDEREREGRKSWLPVATGEKVSVADMNVGKSYQAYERFGRKGAAA